MASNSSLIFRYSIAAAAVIVAIGMRIAFIAIFAEMRYLPFALAVTVAAWFGGKGPGLAATAFSTLGILGIPSLAIVSPAHIGMLVTTLAAGTLISLLVGNLRESLLSKTRSEDILRRQRQLIDFSRDAIITTDSERRIVTWNKGAEQMYGWPEGRAVGKVLHQLLRTIGPISMGEIDETLSRERQWDGEVIHTARDGRRLTVDSRQVRVSSDGEGPAGILEINRDITERKRTQEALRESEERLRLAQQVARVGTFEWDLQTGVDRWTPELEAMYGLAPGEFGGTERAWLELVHPEDQAEAARRDREAMDSGHFQAEWRVICPDGTIRWMHGRGWVFKDDTGKPLRMIGVDIDITDRKQAEEARREAEERFRALVTASSDVVYRVSPDWSEMRYLRGRDFVPDTETPNRTWLPKYIYPDDQPQVMAVISEAIRTKSVFESEHRVIRVDGSLGWMFSRAIPIQDANGQIVEWFGAASDITQRKQAEAALRESERNLRELADSMPQLVWTADPTGSITYVNRQWSEQIGLPLEQSLVDSWTQVLHPEDRNRILSYWHRCLETGEQYQIEHRLRVSSGEYRWFLSRAVPIRDERGRITHWFGTSTDIDDSKRAEERLRQAQKLESVGMLAGGIAHDFNNLLTVIMGSASVGLLACPSCEHSQAILEASERAAHLTRQLLAYSGKGKYVIKTFDLSHLVSRSTQLLSASIPKKVNLVLNLSQDGQTVQGDLSQIEQILINLVLNAAEAIPPKADGRIEIATSTCDVTPEMAGQHGQTFDVEPGRFVCLEVKDNGTGMDEATLSRVFDPFFSTKFTGRGLGLPAVQGIVRSSRGFIEVRSSQGVGSTFQVFLPLAVKQRPTEVPTDSHPTERQEPGSACILVVDDEEMVRRMAGVALRSHGYEVLEAKDGKDALEVLAETTPLPSLVLLDLAMPVMGGDELLPILTKDYPGLKILGCSGYPEEEARRGFPRGTVTGFLQKPFTVGVLMEKIEQALKSGTAPSNRILDPSTAG